ncbi:hypothetical protein [Kribbella sp. VKM Ac-2568]|uniref:hypothetical protein n=1 Tax=Kribbella sp. VKM Ac-2568 TaxID=2512219 RepID=UPI0013053F90|nr:hypothetical protein [Kribbella sp. VKM Ac-2568]
MEVDVASDLILSFGTAVPEQQVRVDFLSCEPAARPPLVRQAGLMTTSGTAGRLPDYLCTASWPPDHLAAVQ